MEQAKKKEVDPPARLSNPITNSRKIYPLNSTLRASRAPSSPITFACITLVESAWSNGKDNNNDGRQGN